MNSEQRKLCLQLVKMESEEAAEWLMSMYPVQSEDYGLALLLIPHRSWRRSEQKRLARYYFKKLPFSGAMAYEAFASVMSVSSLLSCVKEFLPMSDADASLLLYYLIPTLKKYAKNDSDSQLIDEFLNEAQKLGSE